MAEHKTIEEHHLPREMRVDLCMSLLESAGAGSISYRENRGEIIHLCLMPWHNEKTPSAALNVDSLTYRCLGCDAKGGLYWLLATVRGQNWAEVKDWLSTETGLGGKDFQLGPLLEFLDSLENQRATGSKLATMPRYPDKAIEKWCEHIYPGLTTGVPDLGIPGRGIPEENLRASKVGWDMEKNRVVIPNYWKGELVGWQSRRIVNDGTPKYESSPDFPSDSTILGLPERGQMVVVVESPMSYLRHLHHLPVAATWGASISAKQIQLLKWHPEVCFWLDNDPAGWKQIEGHTDDQGQHVLGAAEQLMPYTKVTVVESDWHADPANFDDSAAEALVEARVPLAVWQRPQGALRCLACHERHGGPCA